MLFSVVAISIFKLEQRARLVRCLHASGDLRQQGALGQGEVHVVPG